MDTKIYTATASILLKPISAFRPPHVRVQGQVSVLDTPTWFNFSFSGPSNTIAKLTVEHLDKNRDENNITPGTDIAVIIEQIKLNELSSAKFIWQGVYTPNYPSHFRESMPNELPGHNYLGWDGVWSLEFTLPVYTWIHRVENLGWIYD